MSAFSQEQISESSKVFQNRERRLKRGSEKLHSEFVIVNMNMFHSLFFTAVHANVALSFIS